MKRSTDLRLHASRDAAQHASHALGPLPRIAVVPCSLARVAATEHALEDPLDAARPEEGSCHEPAGRASDVRR